MTPTEAAVIAAELRGFVRRFEEFAHSTEKNFEEVKGKQDLTNGTVKRHDKELAQRQGRQEGEERIVKDGFWRRPLPVALAATLLGSALSAFIFGVILHY